MIMPIVKRHIRELFTEKGVVDGVGQPLGSSAEGEAMECQQC